MMQDYDRTLELVDAAYNSSGASQRQFEKTQDSLESKINRLKNAWNEFLMGISNSTVIKGAIDVLTGILNVVNKVTGAFGTGAGAILKMAAAYGALKVGAKASNKFFNNSTLVNNMIRRS
jgi:TP901 family phage tail tape measure protein